MGVKVVVGEVDVDERLRRPQGIREDVGTWSAILKLLVAHRYNEQGSK